MGTLSSCLKKIGLSEHEAAILRGSTEDNIKDGDAAHVAAVRAVSDYLEQLEAERSGVVSQIGEKGGKAAEAPFKLADLSDLTSVLRKDAEPSIPEGWTQGETMDGRASFTYQPKGIDGGAWVSVSHIRGDAYKVSMYQGAELSKTKEVYGSRSFVLGSYKKSVDETNVAGIHIENGEIERVTPAVVAESVKKSAKNTAFNPKEALAWLTGEVKKAMKAAPTANEKGVWDTFNQKIKLEGIMNVEEAIGFKVFDVPGDGKFKVLNLKESLQKFLAKVESNPGFKNPRKTTGEQTVAPWQKASGSGSESEVREMLIDGDYTAAYEFSKQIGKPMVFSFAAKRHPVPITDVRPFEVEGYEDFTFASGRSWFGKSKDGGVLSDKWQIIDMASGNVVASGSSRKAAETKARADLSGKVTPEKLAKIIADKIASGEAKAQDALEKEWMAWAEEQEGGDSLIAEKKEEPAASISNPEARLDATGQLKDYGWHGAGVGAGGRRQMKRQIELSDGTDIEATLTEHAGRYDNGYVYVNGKEVFRTDDSFDAQEKIDRFIEGRYLSQIPIDNKGFERFNVNSNGTFELRDGNMVVRVEPTENGKYQASFRGVKSSPHLQGIQGAVDWADAYRQESIRSEQKPEATTKQVKDENGNTATEVTLPSGKVVQIQRLNSAESMGLPGWHGPDGYLADTKDGAVKLLVDRESKAAKELGITEVPVIAYGKYANIGQSKDNIIEDFGEKLEGARKDRSPSLSKEISDDDIASQPLSKIWPAAEIDAIENKFVAAVAYSARSYIPAKPRKSYLVKSWVSKVQAMISLTRHALRDVEKFREGLRNWGVLGAEFYPKVALLEAIDREQWKRIGTVSEHPNAYRYGPNGEQIKSPIVRVEVDGRGHNFDDATSVADVIEKVNGLLGVEQEAKKMQFEVRGRGNSYFINKKGDKEYRKLKEFTNTKDAFTFIKENYDELVAAWEGVKDRDNVTKADVRNAENRPRTGEDRRNGQDVTKEMFENAFGFRGVQFGEWVKQGGSAKERQWMLNQAYDALMDLADIVGIPPKAISLNGSLGLAFGARGNGNAAAHFEPGKLVINLTKTQGAGTFAHEWFHALDNYFSRQRNGEVKMSRSLDAKQAYRTSNYITYRPEPMMVHKTQVSTPITRAKLAEYHAKNPKSGYYNPENWKVDPNHPEGVRPEVERAFAELVEALDASPMRARSAKNDKVTDGYWSRIIERGARAFENYVIFKMMEKGYNNDYLANVREVQDFPRAKERYPYLLPEEVAPIAEAFDGLFSTVETKETDKGIAIYNLVDFKPLTEAEMLPTGQIVDTVNQLLEQFKTDIPVTIIDREDDVLPAGPVGNNNVATTEWATSGFVYRGRIHLVREGLNDVESVASTLFHELLHYGIRRFVPKAEYIAQMKALFRSDPWIQAKTEAWLDTQDGINTAKKYGEEYAAARGVDEALAELAEQLHEERTAPGVKIGGGLAKVVQNVINWLKGLASKFGWKPVFERLNDLEPGQQSKDYVESIFKKLREGDNPPFNMTSQWAYSDPAFSRLAKSNGIFASNENTIEVDGVQRPRMNSKGRPIHPREDGIRNFWRWFGSSRVVDEQGRPLVVYHGTKGEFTKFDLERAGSKTDSGAWGRGIYFAVDPEYAGAYAGRAEGSNIVPAYISLQNPLVVDARERTAAIRGIGLEVPRGDPTPAWSQQFANAVAQRGYDGVIVTLDGAPAEIVAFRPEQIKSATGNNGDFDPSSSNIMFAKDAKSTSVSPAEIRAALSERFGESGIKALESAGILKVVRLKDAPEALRVLAEEQGASALYGADGVAYLFSDRMTTEDAPGKLLHEIGEHYGLERMLGADGWGRMKKRIVAMAKAKGSVASAAWDAVKSEYQEFKGMDDATLAGNERFMHEVLAAIGENTAGQQTSLWREILAKVKAWLASKGLLVDWINEGDIANLVSGSLKNAMRNAEAGLVAPEKMESLVETYFRQIVSAMKAADQLIEDCA